MPVRNNAWRFVLFLFGLLLVVVVIGCADSDDDADDSHDDDEQGGLCSGVYPGWRCEPVEKTDDVSGYAIAIGPHDVPAIAYALGDLNEHEHAVMFARQNAGGWDKEILFPGSQNEAWLDLALDQQGAAHIVATNTRELIYLSDRSGVWEPRTLLSDISASHTPVLRIDSKGDLHLLFIYSISKDAESQVVYMQKEDETWNETVLDLEASDATMVLDKMDRPFIGYADHPHGVGVMAQAADQWVKNDIVRHADQHEGYEYNNPIIALSPQAYPHVLFSERLFDYDHDDYVYRKYSHAIFSGNSWQVNDMESFSYLISFLFDNAGNQIMTYTSSIGPDYQSDRTAALYATNVGSGWVSEPMMLGRVFAVAALDSQDRPHFAARIHLTDTNLRLMYLTRDEN